MRSFQRQSDRTPAPTLERGRVRAVAGEDHRHTSVAEAEAAAIRVESARRPVPPENPVRCLECEFSSVRQTSEGAGSIQPAGPADPEGMLFLILLRAILLSRTSLALENLALRQQVAVLKRSVPRPRIRLRDLYWAILRRLWGGWRQEPARCSSFDGGPLASTGLATALAMEVAWRAGTPGNPV